MRVDYSRHRSTSQQAQDLLAQHDAERLHVSWQPPGEALMTNRKITGTVGDTR